MFETRHSITVKKGVHDSGDWCGQKEKEGKKKAVIYHKVYLANPHPRFLGFK
jgi:hypothetical protein